MHDELNLTVELENIMKQITRMTLDKIREEGE